MASLPSDLSSLSTHPLKRLQQQQHMQPDLNHPVAGGPGGCGGLRLDMNRNALSLDRQVYENFKFNCQQQQQQQQQQDNTMNKYMRNNVRNHVNNYLPYPTNMSPFPGFYYRQMAVPLDFGGGATVPNFIPGQPPSHVNQRNTTGGTWPFADSQMNDFCSDLLNRDKHYWTEDETTLMLELYEENRNYFNDTKTKKTKVWSIIANIINKRFNTNVNSEQCSQKYRNLKAEFLKVVDPNNSSESGAKKFGRHFLQMKRLIEFEDRKGSKVVHISPQNAAPATPLKQNTNNNNNNNTTTNNANNSSVTNNEIMNQNYNIKTENSFENTPLFDLTDNKLSNHPLKAAFFPSPQTQDSDADASGKQIKEEFVSTTTTTTTTTTSDKDDITEITSIVDTQQEEQQHKEDEGDYNTELNQIFEEYFKARADSTIEDTKDINTDCLRRCLVVFKKIVQDEKFL